jgi:PTS system N-acetylgalactosamine-specific IIB component
VKGKVPIFKINIGNMHYKEGKKQIHDTVSVSEDDLNTFRQLIDLGVECTIQRNPSDVPIDIRDFI